MKWLQIRPAPSQLSRLHPITKFLDAGEMQNRAEGERETQIT